MIGRWAFVNVGTVVKFHGITISNPVSIVMEYLPLGPLDVYLANEKNRPQISVLNLTEAAVSLANALYYLVKMLATTKY